VQEPGASQRCEQAKPGDGRREDERQLDEGDERLAAAETACQDDCRRRPEDEDQRLSCERR
jgi:hypothetical protein